MLNKSKIISKLLPHALEIQVKYKLLPSVIISQAILETGWLQHCRGNNIFGIKWTRDCGFEFNELSTYEWIDGIKTPKICLFRKYENLSESFSDYAELITSLKRYRPVVAAPNYKEACKELYKCGYCTDPEYPLKLISIIESNELYKHDSIPLLCSQEENNNVELLQTHMNLLNILDYEDKVLIIDGIMGPRTKSAVEKFIDLCSLNIVNWDIKEILKITGQSSSTINTLRKLIEKIRIRNHTNLNKPTHIKAPTQTTLIYLINFKTKKLWTNSTAVVTLELSFHNLYT